MTLPLTPGLPASTRCPEASVIATLLKSGSRSCVKRSVTSRGAARTVLPTRGSASSRKACAPATLPKRTSAAALPRTRTMRMSVAECQLRGRRCVAEDRFAEAVRKQVVEVEVQLSENAHAGAAGTIDGDDRFEADLEIFADPDDARIDKSGGPDSGAVIVGDRRLELKLDDRNQMVEKTGQVKVDHVRPEVRHAVLKRPTVGEKLRVQLLRRVPAIRIDRRSPRLARYCVADLAGQRERSRRTRVVRQAAKPLSDKERWREYAERLGADRPAAGMTEFDVERARHHQFPRRLGQELVLEAGLEILESVDVRTAGRIELRPRRADRNAEIVSDAL